jgi:ricin-type beta-trefoil lectin protein
VTDHDFGDDQDPLLVRPFVLQDAESPEADPSTQTWPSATTREVRSQHAATDESPTQIIPRVASRRRFRRRLLVVGGLGAAVVLAAAAAAFAALRPEVSPSVVAATDPALPVVTGPAPSASASLPSGSAPVTTHGAHRSNPASAKASGSLAPSSGTPSASPPSTRPPTSPAAGATSGGFGAAQPHDASPTGRTGTIRGQNTLCLDLNGNLTFDDNHIDVFTCNNTTAQVWTLATDGTLRVDGRCALIVGDNSVHIVACDGRTTAQWQASNSRLINAANGKCLTDPSGGRLPGTPVFVTTCGGSASQRWSLP